MITLSIDNRDIQVEEGSTILDASQKAGIEIPSLCHDERLAPFGACRICLVEVDGTKTRFTPSCTTPVTEGMKVKTISEEIRKARQAILELLLVNHPLDCPVCDKAGECKLQDLVYEYGVSECRYHSLRLDLPVDRISPLIERNLNRCILCGKCVRVCDEVIGVAETSLVNRGIHTKIGTDFDRPLNCEFCGQCVDICPVGALTSRLFKYKARLWELKKTPTICSFCSIGCSITFGVKDGQILEAYNEKDTGVNGRHLCVKGRFGWQYIHSPQRLTRPLIRRDGELIESTWEEALTSVSERFSYLRETYGGQGLAGLASERLTNEELYLFQKFMRLALRTNNLGTLTQEKTIDVLKRSIGFAASPNSINEIEETNIILLIGGDISSTNPVLAMKVTQAVKKGEIPLMVINSRRVKLSRQAACSLIVKPSHYIALLNGMINLILQQDIFEHISKIEGSKALKDSVLDYTPDYVEKLTGISQAQLEETVKAYTQADNALIIVDRADADLVQTAVNLSLLTGNIGRQGAGIILVAPKANSQGAIDMGVSSRWLPGRQDINDPEIRKGFEEIWGRGLPTEVIGSDDILISSEQGKIKALYLIGQNPILAYPDPKRTEQILRSLDFLVVQDLFLTETAKLADVVLPAVSSAEKDGTFTNLDRRVQRLNRVICPASGWPDWQIIQELSNRLGLQMRYNSTEEIRLEIGKVVPFYEGQWSDTEAGYLYQNGLARVERFYPTEYEPQASDKDYPFELIIDPVLFHSGTMSRFADSLLEVYPEVIAEINPVDAQRVNVTDGSSIRVSSIESSIEVKARISHQTLAGTIFIPVHPQNYAFNLIRSDSNLPVRVKIEGGTER